MIGAIHMLDTWENLVGGDACGTKWSQYMVKWPKQLWHVEILSYWLVDSHFQEPLEYSYAVLFARWFTLLETLHSPCNPGNTRIICVSCSVMSDSLWPHGLQPTRLLCPWNSPGKSTGVGCQSLLQGIFLTQGSNPGLLHCRWILYHLSHQGSPMYNVVSAIRDLQGKNFVQLITL